MDTNKPRKCCQHVYFIIKAHTHTHIYTNMVLIYTHTSLIGGGKIAYINKRKKKIEMRKGKQNLLKHILYII